MSTAVTVPMTPITRSNFALSISYILSDCFGVATTSDAVACFVNIAANLGETCEKIKSTTPKNENQHKILPLCLLCIGTSTPFSPRFYAGMPLRPTAERLRQFFKTGDAA